MRCHQPRRQIDAADADGIGNRCDADLSDPSQGQGRTVIRCLDPAGMNVEVSDFL